MMSVWDFKKYFPSQESGEETMTARENFYRAADEESEAVSSWQHKLDEILWDLDEWLTNPVNVHDALAAVEDLLMRKHHDYGEDNLNIFGEYGVLVRVSDKVARLKNLIEVEGQVGDESRADTWRDLAGYAIQALIMLSLKKNTEQIDVFQKRKNRLIRGLCPDCGEGVLLRESFWSNNLHCSEGCGFETGNLYELHIAYEDFNGMIEYLATLPAIAEQK